MCTGQVYRMARLCPWRPSLLERTITQTSLRTFPYLEPTSFLPATQFPATVSFSLGVVLCNRMAFPSVPQFTRLGTLSVVCQSMSIYFDTCNTHLHILPSPQESNFILIPTSANDKEKHTLPSLMMYILYQHP